MFTWHEATRRSFCRLVFLALAFGPTCAVLLAAVWIGTPQALAMHRRALAEQLALEVELARVSFPLPGVTRYEGLAVTDPETGDWLARVQLLELDDSPRRTVVSCAHPELNAQRLDLFWELALRRLRRQTSLRRPTELVSRDVNLDFGQDVQTLADVHVRFKQGDAGPQGLVVFHLADQPPEAEARMAIFRSRQAAGAGTLVQLETGQAVVPGSLLAAILPGWNQLGRRASLMGSLWWQDGTEGFSGQVRGEISGVDLDALVTNRFAQKLGGTATIQLERARIGQGRLVEAKGSMSAGPGLVSRALVAAAATHLCTPAAALSDAPGTLVAYEQLGFQFTLDESGLIVTGNCSMAPAGTLLLGRSGRPILTQPAADPQSPLNLVRTLAAGGEQPLPISAAAQDLIRLLPTSEIAPRTARIQPASPTLRR